MKTFKHILPFLLALLVLAGCEDDVNYTQGTAENPDCYGVYFPKKQATRTDLEFEPGTQTEATYTVKRRNTVDPIVVPVVVKSNVEDIFVVEPIAFDAGEDETTFTISFPKAQMGTTYTCDINIEDPRYASIYGADKVNLSISLVLAKWELVTDEKTGETKGRYRDDILGNFASIDNPNANPNPEIELEIYERSDKKGYYRMKAYTPELMNIFAGGQVNHENRNVWTYVDASDPNKVYYPYQSTGLTLFSDMGEWYIASQTPENFAMDESAGQYGTLNNGVITFPAQGIVLEPSEGEYAGKFFYANANGLQRIMLPGARVYDYSVALTKSEPADGVVEIGATLSEDTREFRYAIFTGNLSDGEASLKAQEMADGKIAAELIKTITASGTISVQDLEGGTGKYTLVGCIYGSDEEANPEGGETASQNLKMQGYASISFGYIAKGDEDKVSVILNIGLEATNEFAGQGITTDNAAKFWAYGEEIESVKYGVFKTKAIQGLDMTAFLQQMGKDFTKEQLDAINGGHYSIMLTGLNGDTEYTFAGLGYNVTKYYLEVSGRNILYRYTIEYADAHRKALNAVRTTADLRALLDADRGLVDDFIRYAARKGVAPRYGDIARSRQLMEAQLKAYIGRNTSLEDSGYFLSIYPEDEVIVRAIGELEHPTIPTVKAAEAVAEGEPAEEQPAEEEPAEEAPHD